MGSSARSLELRDVSVRFGGIAALSEVSLTARPGRVLGVIGPNGAGKTTLFNVACGFVRPDAGTIVWGGRELHGLRPHQLAGLGIARTLQGLGLFDRMTVLDNVLVGADAQARCRLPVGAARPAALRARGGAAARAGAGPCSTSSASRRTPTGYPGSLPYAVRKKVALARALVSEPELVMLDEPASGLSEDELAELGRRLRGLAERMSVMLVEHHMDLVMSVCDDITVLDFGKVIASGTPDEVRDDPAVLAAYLGEAVP